MSENYEYVRNSVIPHLLESESVSANAVYPHRIFEVGKTVVVDHSENYGSRTRNTLGLLIGSGDADFNQLNAHIAALLYYLVAPYELAEHADARFIDGRCAAVRVNGQEIGIFGEVHPQVLENWGVEVPCAAAEFDLDRLLQAREGTASAE
jgi:phenylalanyl-tRNA synthetase beta chain